MSKITDEIMGHGADNDGIEEYDNPMPDWWVGLFVVTVVWGVLYGVNYHFIQGDSQLLRYEAEMAMADERWPQSDVAAPLVFDAESLEAGEEIFIQTCVACHMEGGTGGPIGPSLVDAEWLHGAEPEQIRATISEGVTAKGMPAWGQVLGPEKVRNVAAYVVELHKAAGAGVAPAGEAAGDDVEAEAAPTEAPEDAPDWDALSQDERHAYLMKRGELVYTTGDGGLACVACHQANGQGLPGAFPPLVGQKDHMGDCAQHAGLVLNGLSGEIVVDGKTYNGVMTPQRDQLDDLQIAAVISYTRQSWGNDYGFCTPEDVAAARSR